MDFNIKSYLNLVSLLLEFNYSYETSKANFSLIDSSNKRTYIVLRHDVDRLPQNALKMAKIEYQLGICSTYYFRIVPESFDQSIIEKIAALGHEIGYHYEDLDLVFKKAKRNGQKIKDENELIDLAMESFIENLEKLRKLYPVKTICMHGSPLSKYDNRLLWKKYNYRDYGIIGEPYFDIDFNEVLYLTDTGRRWNAGEVSIRDKVESSFSYNFKSTFDIIDNIDRLPPKIMLNVHPQRWHDQTLPWVKELLGQNIKNAGKYLLSKYRS